MLQIQVPPDGLSELDYTKLSNLNIPEPASGFKAELNNTVIMPFENEQEAIDYAHVIDEYAESLGNEDSEEFLAIVDMIKAIGDDIFVQDYIQS